MQKILKRLFTCDNILNMESTHDRVAASFIYENRETGIHKRGGGAYDGL